MDESFEPSPDFVDRVMRQVRLHERKRVGIFLDWLCYLAAGGAFLGLLRAAPVF